MTKKLTIICISTLFLTFKSIAQETTTTTPTVDSLNKSLLSLKHDLDNLKKLKITGWVQAQFQHADTAGAKNFDGGDFMPSSNNRFYIRRGRVKFTYNQKNSQYVLQLNATERGVNLVEIFAKVTDPWINSITLSAGVMNRPFGFEIQQSSADRETPERSRFLQILVPNERDLGAMITYAPTKKQKLFGLKIDAGFFNGTGIAVPGSTSLNGAGVTEFDKFKDFIGRLYYTKNYNNDKVKFGIGFSHYRGGFARPNNNNFNSTIADTAGNLTWKSQDVSGALKLAGKQSPRIYYAGEIQLSFVSLLGTTTIRGEYITGVQSGFKDDTKSPSAAPSATLDTYQREFNGSNVYFIQRLGKSKHEIAIKYEWYDPNVKVSGENVNSKYGFGKGDIKYTALGVGYNFYLDQNVKFMFHYNMVKNELTKISGYTYDLKDNIFTARVQYRF